MGSRARPLEEAKAKNSFTKDFAEEYKKNRLSMMFLFAMITLLCASLPLVQASEVCRKEVSLAIGSYTNISWIPTASGAGITLLKLRDGAISQFSVIPPSISGANPTYLAVSLPHVFAANSNAPSGAVTKLKFSESGALVNPIQISSETPTTTHISTIEYGTSRKIVITASYAGAVTSYISSGRRFEIADVFKVPKRFASQLRNPELSDKQSLPHPHMALAYGLGVLITDLGSDYVFYLGVSRGSGKFRKLYRIRLRPGDGPRHADLHRYSGTVYVLNEISLTISILNPSCGAGKLAECSRVNLLDYATGDGVSAAAIRVSADGNFLYASVRFNEGMGLVVGFMLEAEKGTVLKRIGEWSSRGLLPRDIYLVGPVQNGGACRSYVAIANRMSDNLVLIERDTQSGMLADEVAFNLSIGTPASIIEY